MRYAEIYGAFVSTKIAGALALLALAQQAIDAKLQAVDSERRLREQTRRLDDGDQGVVVKEDVEAWHVAEFVRISQWVLRGQVTNLPYSHLPGRRNDERLTVFARQQAIGRVAADKSFGLRVALQHGADKHSGSRHIHVVVLEMCKRPLERVF